MMTGSEGVKEDPQVARNVYKHLRKHQMPNIAAVAKENKVPADCR
jgi:hypothetical protein